MSNTRKKVDSKIEKNSDNTPRTPKARRASFDGFFEPSTSRPSTSPTLPFQRRGSVTSATAHLLSRSRQELSGLSLSPSPRSPRRHSVFDFGNLNQNPTQNSLRKSSLPEIKNSDSCDPIDNNNNNNNNNSSNNRNSCNNESNNSSNNNDNKTSDRVAPRNYSKLSTNINADRTSHHNVSFEDSTITNTNKEKLTSRQSQRRHSSADTSRTSVSSVTIKVLNKNVNSQTTKATISSTTDTVKTHNNINLKNSDQNSGDSNRQTMTVGTERRGSKQMTSEVKVQPPARRSSLGNLTTANSSNNALPENLPKSSMAGKKSPTRLNSRRGSSDSNASSSSSSPRLRKNLQRLSIHSLEEVSHNETVVLIHRDEDEPEIVSTSPESSESGSMFSRKPKRRLSEPAVGGHYLRALQSSVRETEEDNKTSGHGLNGSGSCTTLRQTIEEELPSGIVAEEDEDRYNEETEKQSKSDGGNKNNLDKKDGGAANSSSPSELSLSLSSSSNASLSKGTKTKQSKETSNPNGKTTQQRRRKSEGDVLKFARIWRLHAGNSESLRALLKEDRPEPVKAPVDTKDAIWDAVRKCRYIRGYDPADTSEQTDLGEYVFGHHKTEPPIAN